MSVTATPTAPVLTGIQTALQPIVANIVTALESGNAPWVKPWGDRRSTPAQLLLWSPVLRH